MQILAKIHTLSVKQKLLDSPLWGEEFVVLGVDVSHAEFTDQLDGLRNTVQHTITASGQVVTISIGTCTSI